MQCLFIYYPNKSIVGIGTTFDHLVYLKVYQKQEMLSSRFII